MYNAIICAIAKNENLYINEWVNHHISIGFDHIFIYDNNDDSTPYVGDFIEQKDKVTIYNIHGLHEQRFQPRLYNEFYHTTGNIAKWIAFIDIDEFITGVDDINKFLSNPQFDNFDQVRLRWLLFGDDDKITRDTSIPVMQSFVRPVLDRKISKQGKTIAKTNLKNVIISSCHFISDEKTKLPKKECTPSGREITDTISINDYDGESIFVNHYRTKTLAEFIEQKVGRGDACFADRSIDLDYFWRSCNKTEEKLEWLKTNNLLT